MKPTIKEVAREAGVSIATVSRVLNGKDKVKTGTREKVEDAIRRLNFQPDENARNMIRKTTRTIGMIVTELSNDYWAQLFDLLQEQFWPRGYMLFVGSTGHNFEKERAFIQSFIDRRVDGIIVGSSLYGPDNEKNLALIRGYGVPLVSLDPKNRDMNCVFGDHLQGATDAVEHLIRLGHRSIAFIGGTAVPDTRELGYRNAFILNGLTVDEALIRRSDNTHTYPFGYQAASELLACGAPFTAVFCYNDAVAFGVIRALEERGLRVSDDVAIVGYDDVRMAGVFKPHLTTVRQPIREIAAALAELLLESIEGGGEGAVPVPPRNISFRMELIVRDSCGAGRATG